MFQKVKKPKKAPNPDPEASKVSTTVSTNDEFPLPPGDYKLQNQYGAPPKQMPHISKMSMKNGPKSNSSICGMIFCATDLIASKHNREEYIRTSLLELAVYLVYLTILCMITYGTQTSSSYYYTNIISRLFLDTPLGHGSRITFKTSTTVEDFWRFTETTMVDGLYWKYWYGVQDPNNQIPEKHQGVLYENKLLGRPRLRQVRNTSFEKLRVSVEPCPVSEKFHRLFKDCYPYYSYSHEEKKPYLSPYANYDAWKYHTEKELNGSSHWGRLAHYSGAGAFQLLGTEKEETLQIIMQLKNNLWITRATRVIFLDFTMYNANVNLFCIVKLIWEFPPTGGVLTSWNIHTIKLLKYSSPFDYFILVLEFVFCGFTIFYTCKEIFEMISMKCSEYWGNFWNYIDITILLISYACIAFSIFRHLLVAYVLEYLLIVSTIYANFYWIGYFESYYTNGVALLTFFCWISLFKYISFNKTMSQLSSTMSRCAADIGGFSIMFFIVFFAFAQLGYLLFGSQVEDFRSFHDTVFALLRLILGDFNFRAMESANRVLGPAFFLTYVFFVFFVLLNMFLAIINDTYSQVKAEVNSHGEEFQVTDYLKRGFSRLFKCGSKKADIERQIKLANSQNVIKTDELRANLMKANYTEVEVEMFLARYELDEERPIDVDEAEYVLGSLEGHHLPGDNIDNVSPAPKPAEGSKELNDEEISELQSRVGVLETSLTSLTRKIDNLMRKLDSMEKAPDKKPALHTTSLL